LPLVSPQWGGFGVVYNNKFGFPLWSNKNMIRFLQTAGQTTKYILGGLLLIICASMVITLIPGGLSGDVFGGGQPGRGIIAKVGVQGARIEDAMKPVGANKV